RRRVKRRRNGRDLPMFRKSVRDFFALGIACSLVSACEAPVPRPGVDLVTAAITSGGTFAMQASNSWMCVDVTGASTADGANVEQWTCNGQTNQQWLFRDTGGGVFEVSSVNSGKCLDVDHASTANGANVLQWACHGSLNQR